MRKALCVIILSSLLISSAGCTSSGGNTQINSRAEQQKIDIDLTALSSTMVYAEVYNMMCEPDDYVGKVIKMGGQCTTFKNFETGQIYYTCLIQDATACCSQGIEFTLTDDCEAPYDYPQEGDEIEVVGTFETYTEDGMKYCALKQSSIVSLDPAQSDAQPEMQ